MLILTKKIKCFSISSFCLTFCTFLFLGALSIMAYPTITCIFSLALSLFCLSMNSATQIITLQLWPLWHQTLCLCNLSRVWLCLYRSLSVKSLLSRSRKALYDAHHGIFTRFYLFCRFDINLPNTLFVYFVERK